MWHDVVHALYESPDSIPLANRTQLVLWSLAKILRVLPPLVRLVQVLPIGSWCAASVALTVYFCSAANAKLWCGSWHHSTPI